MANYSILLLLMLLFHGLSYSVEFSVVAVSFILSFDFLFQRSLGNNLIKYTERKPKA